MTNARISRHGHKRNSFNYISYFQKMKEFISIMRNMDDEKNLLSPSSEDTLSPWRFGSHARQEWPSSSLCNILDRIFLLISTIPIFFRIVLCSHELNSCYSNPQVKMLILKFLYSNHCVVSVSWLIHFPPNVKNKAKMVVLTTSIQYWVKDSSQRKKLRKRNKSIHLERRK